MLPKKLLHLNNHFPDQLSLKLCTRLEAPPFKVLLIQNQRNTSSQSVGLKQILHKACSQGEEHKGKSALSRTDAGRQITGQAAHGSMKYWDFVTSSQTNTMNSCRFPKTFLSSSFQACSMLTSKFQNEFPMVSSCNETPKQLPLHTAQKKLISLPGI